MSINKRRVSPARVSHSNWMGGKSFKISPLVRLRTAAASCFFGEPMYYHGQDMGHREKIKGGSLPSRLSASDLERLRETLDATGKQEWRSLNPDQMMERAIDDALEHDARGTLEFAVTLRQQLNMRTTPQVIMVRAAKHPSVKGSPLLAEFSRHIMHRMDEPMVQMAYHLKKFGKPLPSNLKRAWARRVEVAKPYELAKYRMEGREVNIYDLINVSHPRANEHINKLMKGRHKLGGQHKTWESVRSGAGKTENKEQAKEVWTEASKHMGHMALLRNLRNLEQNKSLTDEHLAELVKGVERGRQLPFRYYTAYQAMSGSRPAVLDAIEECLERSFAHAPRFKGRTMSLSDNSGSAHGAVTSDLGSMSIAQIGNLMAVMTAKMSDEGHIGVFGDRLAVRAVRKKSSVFDELERMKKAGDYSHIGWATENGLWLFWREAIEKKQHWDNVFVYSDMQAGHGGLYGLDSAMGWCPRWRSRGSHIDVPELIKRYRREVNPKVNVFLVQVAGYQDTLVPETYRRTYILGGWSQAVLQYADYMIDLADQLDAQS